LLYGSGSAPVGPQSVPIYLIIDSRSVNSGILKTNGWDFSARYSLKTALGKWNFADTFTYVADYRQSLVPGSALVGYLNTYGYPVRFSTRAQIGWEKNGASANLFVNYTNPYTNTQVTPNVTIASTTTFDLTLGYDMGPRPGSYGLDNLSFQVSAQNLFDRKPPFALVNVPPTQTFDTQNASAIGRLISLNIQKRW
jgi:iron complex outermembrane receptor protein